MFITCLQIKLFYLIIVFDCVFKLKVGPFYIVVLLSNTWGGGCNVRCFSCIFWFLFLIIHDQLV